ncbi:MAG: Uma2 family endonuclease [Cyanobacteria bacterium J06634_6]
MVQQLTQQLPDKLPDTKEFEAVDELDTSHLVIEDDAPVDNLQSAQQQRLLVNALCGSKAISAPFVAEANVGLFYQLKGDPVVPDMLLSLGIQRAEDFSQRQHRAYFVWEFGKVPDVCVEVVSNKEGDEVALSQRSKRKGKQRSKQEVYAQIGVPYYVVFDPLQQIQDEPNMNGALLRVWTLTSGRYVELTPDEGIAEVGQSVWLETVGLGLTLWEGEFEEKVSRMWLRWCDRQGRILPTGIERADTEQQRADTEQQRADTEQQRADTEQQRADTEQQRADTEQQRANRLAERLRSLGIDPDEA